ncbi:MAG: C40 family peptidase [Deltaproteobacteria bacterium]|nr:C40 family peptidase [Deltaproteobacteria bacterium]
MIKQSTTALTLVAALALTFLVGCAGHKTLYTEREEDAKKGRMAVRVVKTARSQLGNLYRVGGANPQKGFDCSGFVQWVYVQHHVPLPRTTEDQLKAGEKVKKDDLKPADLVFFKIDKGNFFSFFSQGNLHVGLYTGNGKFIHSPRVGEHVREEYLEEKYWDKRYIGSRRILK